MPSSAMATATTGSTATAPGPASSTTPPSTSTTRSFRSGPATSPGWWNAGCRRAAAEAVRFPSTRPPQPRKPSMPLSHTRRSLAAAAGLLALGAALPARAQQRLIHLVVPFGTGAVQDTVARAFNNELGAALDASVIIENRAGAGGTVGAALAAKAAPDGNTLVLAAASHHIAGFLYAKLPYDPLKDFVGVANLGNAGYVLAVAGDLPVASTADFIPLVKAQPATVNYASAGKR